MAEGFASRNFRVVNLQKFIARKPPIRAGEETSSFPIRADRTESCFHPDQQS